jgi:hypothetical protein
MTDIQVCIKNALFKLNFILFLFYRQKKPIKNKLVSSKTQKKFLPKRVLLFQDTTKRSDLVSLFFYSVLIYIYLFYFSIGFKTP